jgi:hypothetical protein
VSDFNYIISAPLLCTNIASDCRPRGEMSPNALLFLLLSECGEMNTNIITLLFFHHSEHAKNTRSEFFFKLFFKTLYYYNLPMRDARNVFITLKIVHLCSFFFVLSVFKAPRDDEGQGRCAANSPNSLPYLDDSFESV